LALASIQFKSNKTRNELIQEKKTETEKEEKLELEFQNASARDGS